MQPRLFVLMAVSKQSGNQMHNKIDRAAMARMLDLRNVLELVNDRFNDRSFAQQQFVRKVHEMVLPVFAQFGDELESLFKEQLAQRSRDGAAITKELATQMFDHLGNRRPIINVARCQTTCQQLASIIDCQVQFKTIEPSHIGLTSLGVNSKDTVLMDPFGITDDQRRRINEADARADSIVAV